MNIAGKMFGVGGPVPSFTRKYFSPVHDYFVEAGRSFGYKKIDASDPDKIGFAASQMNSRNGIRASMSEAYLRPVAKKQNVLIKTGAKVLKVGNHVQQKI